MPTDLDALANRYLDGALDDEDRAELEAGLSRDPAHLRRFRELLALHGLLVGRFARLHDPAEVMAKIEGADVGHTTSSVLKAIEAREPTPRTRYARGAAKRPARFAPWIWSAAAAAAVLLAVLIAVVMSRPAPVTEEVQREPVAPLAPPPLAQLDAHAREASVVRGGEPVGIEKGMALLPGDVLHTGEHGELRLRFFDDGGDSEGTIVQLDDETELVLGWASDGGKRLALQAGTLSCSVAPQPEGKPLRVVTREATAVVLGTQFQVSVSEHLTRLEVKQGEVQLKREERGERHEDSVLVKAGHFALAKRGEALGAPQAIARPVPAPRPEPVELTGFLSAEVYELPGAKEQVRYHLTDRHGNKYQISVPERADKPAPAPSRPKRWTKPSEREPAPWAPTPPPIDLADHVGKLVRLRGHGVLRKAASKKLESWKLESFRLEELEELDRLPDEDAGPAQETEETGGEHPPEGSHG